jgi:S-adenosylmethionine decarboxylase
MNQIANFTERIRADVIEQRKLTHSPASAAGEFLSQNGFSFAGTHLLLDFWDATNLDDLFAMEQAFREAVDAAGATLLRLDFHRFTPSGGLSGLALLAESHISIHTWPEHGFAAADVFMCGAASPHKAAQVLKAALRPSRMTIGEHRRGVSI